MSSRHSQPIRGLMSAKTSPLFQGRFGRMFRSLPPARFGQTDADNESNLASLGKAMVAPFDPPKDGKDDEESGIPALYTYLGQFIDHDITFDPASSLQKQRTRGSHSPTAALTGAAALHIIPRTAHERLDDFDDLHWLCTFHRPV